jgi:molybdate transport system substrate-binding protein
MKISTKLSILSIALLVTVAGPLSAPAQDTSVTVFAAASMKNALDDVAKAYTDSTRVKVISSYAASSALARQIESGAPADLFISADTDWMDYVAKKDLIRANTRIDLLGNRIVLIAPKDSKTDKVDIKPGFDLAGLVGDARIATGDVAAVPVGKYAKAALEKFGVWDKAAPKFAMAENVRAALMLVARGEAAYGIVYQTDAAVEPGVKIVGVFPTDSHPAITYPVALLKDAKPYAESLLNFLRTTAAKTVFEKYGFAYLIPPQSM